ncbi:MAG: Arc-like binding domain [Herminiimonas sp.]|nr:Arc-like binding domain [Herminiimonas sp.]
MEQIGVMIRLPLDIRNWLAEYAKQQSRSMNGQVVAILKEKMSASQTDEATNATVQ